MNCGGIQYAQSDIKTRRCPYCNRRIKLDWSKIKPLFASHSAREAVQAVKNLKYREKTDIRRK